MSVHIRHPSMFICPKNWGGYKTSLHVSSTHACSYQILCWLHFVGKHAITIYSLSCRKWKAEHSCTWRDNQAALVMCMCYSYYVDFTHFLWKEALCWTAWRWRYDPQTDSSWLAGVWVHCPEEDNGSGGGPSACDAPSFCPLYVFPRWDIIIFPQGLAPFSML